MRNVLFPNFHDLLPKKWNNINVYKYKESGIYDFVHPEVIDTGLDTIGGYRYWLISSTHPQQNALYEDEFIFVSNDFAEWKRIRGFNELYDSSKHAASLSLPNHSLVDPTAMSYEQLLPIPTSGLVVVDGVSKEVSEFLKHDPAMTYDPVEKAIYIYLVYNFKFVGDPVGTPVNLNQINVCIRTYDGVNWQCVRSDGSYFLLDGTSSLLMFTQTEGKNNYINYRKNMPEIKGKSVVKHNNVWYMFYGNNGTYYLTGDNPYSINFSVENTVNGATGNHPSHFSYDGNLYRWDNLGISLFDVPTQLFNKLPINAAYRGYLGEYSQYKKSMYVSGSSIVFAVSEDRDSFFYYYNAAQTNTNPSKSSPITIGMINNAASFIQACSTVKKRVLCFY